MHDELVSEPSLMIAPPRGAGFSPVLIVASAILTLCLSAATCVGAILAPAPPAAVPVLVLICVGGPLFAAWELPPAILRLRIGRASHRELSKLRRTLAQLPETEHPLGL